MISSLILFFSFNLQAEVACNGSVANCAKPYNQVAYATTHNSFNYAQRGLVPHGPLGFIFPNQERPIQTQLKDGIRAFMPDLHYYKGVLPRFKGSVILCHGGKGCGFIGYERAIPVFEDIRRFLAANPGEVITLIIESYVSVRDLSKVLDDSGLKPYVHCQDLRKPWPTLGEMVSAPSAAAGTDSNEIDSPNCNRLGRLVILNDTQDSEFKPAWNLNAYNGSVGDDGVAVPSASFETPFSAAAPSDLKCVRGRGDPNAGLFIFNHFLTRVTGRRSLAAKINSQEYLISRARECASTLGHVPNFVTVDFYRRGDVVSAVRELNRR